MKVWIFALALVFVAAPAFAGSAILTWQDNSNNELGFNIEKKAEACAGTGSWSALSSVAANVKTYTDTAVAEGGTYCYRVNAYNTAGTSLWSNTAGVTIPFTVPVAPSQLGVTAGQ